MNYRSIQNRLIKVTNKDGEIKSEFSYDVLGRRTSKETEDKIIKYTYSSSDIIQEDIYEKDDGKVKLEETRENIYGKGVDDIVASIVKKDKKSKIYFFHKNQLGSIVAITDEKGNMVEEYKYNVFGKAYVRNGKSDNWREFKESKIGNERLFTGREYDREIGLYYYRARYYSADLGGFISRDPIGQVDDINLYSYVGNNPLKFVDPMGREKRFIQAYDYYLDLKGQIYNDYGTDFDLGFLYLSQNEQVNLFTQYNNARDLAQKLHYNRNLLNTNLPNSIEQAKAEGWYNVIADYHQFNVPKGDGPNIKYVSSDGKKEVVFDYQGNIVLDNEDLGTYNFFSPSSDGIKHIRYDVKPWEEWGNNLYDTTEYQERKQIYTGLF